MLLRQGKMFMLQGKEILLATMHQKEIAIKPAMEETLGCKVIVPKNYDTDQFGTFCGEKQRLMSAKKMVVHKAKVAMKRFSYEWGMASEGSFGPHPLMPFTPMHEELLAFIDDKNQVEIVVTKQTHKTNYGMFEFSQNDSFDEFLSAHFFPSHAMIVRALGVNQVIAKGIQSYAELKLAIQEGFVRSKKIRLETDMRAMVNPTRMQFIKELTLDLINRIQSVCAKCGTYGFGEVDRIGNLPCSYCHGDTNLFRNIIEKCNRCDYQIIKPRPDNLYEADPTYCNDCNP